MTRVHLIAKDNGAGLSRDLVILTRALVEGGFDLTVSAVEHSGLRRQLRMLGMHLRQVWRGLRKGAAHARFDVNLMDERVRPKYLSMARRNVLLPHPEWFAAEWQPSLHSFDRVFAKTHHAVPIFEALGCAAEFVGFTSFDRRLAEVPRERAFFHLGGRSTNKGSQALLDAWLLHPQWPTLTVVQRAPLRIASALPSNLHLVTAYLDDAELRVLQNRHLFHLCPSDTEGFGHHLVEGMSCGAITLSTDAPPMNEMIGTDRGVLVPYARTGTQALATTYVVEPPAISAGIERLLALEAAQRTRMSAQARLWWEHNDRGFQQRLIAAINRLADE